MSTDNFDKVWSERNLVSRVEELESALRAERRRNARLSTLSAASEDAGSLVNAKISNVSADNLSAVMSSSLLSEENQFVVGGRILLSKGAGFLAQDAESTDSTLDFGKAMTAGEWVVFQGLDGDGSYSLEWVLVGALVSGTVYSVTRDVDGSGANAWAAGAPFAVVGADGDNRIELVAGATGTIRLITQGATWDAYTVQSEMSTVAGAVTAGAGVVKLNANGILIQDNADITDSVFSLRRITQVAPPIDEYYMLSMFASDSAATIEGGVGGSAASLGHIVFDANTITLKNSAIAMNTLQVNTAANRVGIAGDSESGQALKVTGKIKSTDILTANGVVFPPVDNTSSPTVTAIVNLDSIGTATLYWNQISAKAYVCWGVVASVNPTATATLTQWRFPLPSSIVISSSAQVVGNVFRQDTGSVVGGILGNAAQNAAQFRVVVDHTDARDYFFNFTVRAN